MAMNGSLGREEESTEGSGVEKYNGRKDLARNAELRAVDDVDDVDVSMCR